MSETYVDEWGTWERTKNDGGGWNMQLITPSEAFEKARASAIALNNGGD